MNARRRNTLLICQGALMLALGACANYQPIVDTKNVDMNKYNQDLAECQQYAAGISPATEGLQGAALGATVGAAIGAVAGAFVGDAGLGAGAGAALGGTEGAIGGAANGAQGQTDVIRNCLSGRGYSVLR